jgi:hypothetical protein
LAVVLAGSLGLPALVLLALACGDNATPGAAAGAGSAGSAGSAGASGASPLPLDGFIEQYCDLFKPCCALANLPTDGRQCRAFVGAFVPAGAYNPQAGGDCLAKVRTVTDAAALCSGMSIDVGTACQGVFSMAVGAAKPGEACQRDGDCAPSTEGKVDCATNFGSAGTEERRCQVQIRGKEGDMPCAGTVDGNSTSYPGLGAGMSLPARAFLCNVADGLQCDGMTRACVRMKMPGEACTGRSRYECVPTAFCDQTARTCQIRRAIGATCTPGLSLQPPCVQGAYCAMTRQCAAQVADGAPCTAREQCASGSCVNGACSKGLGSNPGLTLLCGMS